VTLWNNFTPLSYFNRNEWL